jgi:hypothetical protein
MKKFISRYSHWLALLVVSFSFITMFVKFEIATPDLVAIIFGGIGLLSLAYLTFVVEKHIKKQSKEK